MLAPAIVFVLVAGIIIGVYWLLVVRPEQELLDRLRPKEEQKAQRRRGGIIKAPEEQVSTVGPLKSLLGKSSRAQRLQTFIQQSGVKMTVGTFLLLTLVGGTAAFLLAQFFIHFLILSVIAAALAASLPYAYISRVRTLRTRKFEEHFPEAIDLIARALRAGHALPTGLAMVADEIPPPVGTEFKLLYDQQNFGMTLPDAMRIMAARVPVLDARFFVTAVLTQRDTGGNLAEVLDNLSAIIRERFKVKRQVRVISAHGRITGWVLSALPPSLAMVTLLINKDHLGTLTGDPLGQQMIVVALVLQVVGTLIIRKIVDIEYLTPMTTSLLLTLVAVFGAVALATGGAVFYVLQQTAPERRRLGRVNRPVATGVVIEGGATLTGEPTNFYKQVTTILPKSRKEMSKIQRLMARAGYHTPTPIAVYILAQAVSPVVLGIAPFFFGPVRTVWPIAAILALFGWLLPGVVVGRLISKRQKVIQNGLPDALDLMIVCLEAGSGLDQAIMKVSDELDLAYPALAEEFRMLLTETRAGKARLEAFRNLSSRTGVDDVRALVAMLVQTDRFGTSVSQALRTHAEVSRTKRRQRAEEKAAKIGVKMVFPLVFCLFPAFFVVTLGPAVIKFVRIMFGQIMGQ